MVGLAGAEVEKCEIRRSTAKKKIPNNMPGVSVKRLGFAWAFGSDLVHVRFGLES